MRAERLVVLVNETMARTVWPNQTAIGKCVRAGHGDMAADMDFGSIAQSLPCREVIGVVADSRARSVRPTGNEARQMQYYVPFTQLPPPPFDDVIGISGLFVEVTGDAGRVASAIQRTLQANSRMPLHVRVVGYQDLIDPQLRTWRLGATLFSAFGMLALAIAASGIFGVISWLTSQRTREIGVRMALGAPRQAVWRLVVRDALRLVMAGIVVGVGAALFAGPLVRDLLFETSPWEPVTFAGATLVLLAASVCAAMWPALSATRVSPVIALRTD
jgi:ABC-type antimicrobial peptide transport system permease subunit